jgi:hypothetical protein
VLLVIGWFNSALMYLGEGGLLYNLNLRKKGKLRIVAEEILDGAR